MSAQYVQAWRVTYPKRPLAVVYDQRAALDLWAAGPTGTRVEAITVVRHADGGREYLPGALAGEVARHRAADEAAPVSSPAADDGEAPPALDLDFT